MNEPSYTLHKCQVARAPLSIAIIDNVGFFKERTLNILFNYYAMISLLTFAIAFLAWVECQSSSLMNQLPKTSEWSSHEDISRVKSHRRCRSYFDFDESIMINGRIWLVWFGFVSLRGREWWCRTIGVRSTDRSGRLLTWLIKNNTAHQVLCRTMQADYLIRLCSQSSSKLSWVLNPQRIINSTLQAVYLVSDCSNSSSFPTLNQPRHKPTSRVFTASHSYMSQLIHRSSSKKSSTAEWVSGVAQRISLHDCASRNFNCTKKTKSERKPLCTSIACAAAKSDF